MTDYDHGQHATGNADELDTMPGVHPLPDPARQAIVIQFNARTMYHAADACPLCGSVVRYIAANRRGGCVKCNRYRVAQHRADPVQRAARNAARRAAYHHARAVADFDRLIDEAGL